jgi:hypothetical protein
MFFISQKITGWVESGLMLSVFIMIWSLFDSGLSVGELSDRPIFYQGYILVQTNCTRFVHETGHQRDLVTGHFFHQDQSWEYPDCA